MSVSTKVVATLLFLRIRHAGADEMGWGDVAADGSLTTRSLDVPVASARGTENLFQQDPMASHDWAHVSTVDKSLKAQMALAGKSGSSIERLEAELRPLYIAMPKDEYGMLANGTVRYALHRYFHDKKGWTMKGLQPAGGSWIKSMSVTFDVKEVSKYMVPTYLQDVLMKRTGRVSTDLHSLAILAATLEHLIHAELIDNLYSVYSTMGLPTAGDRSEKEIEEILDIFMMVYAFGMNLEISTYEDMKQAQNYLENKHTGWPLLRTFAQGIKNRVLSQHVSGSNARDFSGILRIIEEVGKEYAQWQNRDCNRAKDILLAHPTLKDGRVVSQEVRESRVDGYRALFTEDVSDLTKLGVLDVSSSAQENESSRLMIVPNYINSQSMCLSTASFYTACCKNECEGLIAALERGAAGPTAEPQKLRDIVAALPTAAAGDPTKRLEDLKNIAAENGGSVPIHSRAMAEWMHREFPTQCPAPNGMPTTNPKTPDEWMKDPSDNIQDTEDMMSEIAAFLAQYTALGAHLEASETPQEQVDQPDEVISISHRDTAPQQGQRSSVSKLFQIVSVLSMLGIAWTALRTGLSATGRDLVKKEKFGKLDYLA